MVQYFIDLMKFYNSAQPICFIEYKIIYSIHNNFVNYDSQRKEVKTLLLFFNKNYFHLNLKTANKNFILSTE